jgi:hypothetical protein
MKTVDIGNRQRWVVRFTPQAALPPGKEPRYPLDRRLGGPQSRSGLCGGDKILSLLGIEHRSSIPSPITTPTELSRILEEGIRET